MVVSFMKKYVKYQEKVSTIIETYPFLKEFITDDGYKTNFSSQKINDFLKEDFCEYHQELTNKFINELLNKLVKKGISLK